MNKKYHVQLSETDREYIEMKLNDENTSKSIRKRCNILLMADETAGKPPTQEEIAKRCSVCDVTIYHTIRDYCTNGIEEALQYQSRTKPSREPIVTGEVEARLIALACGEPPQGFSRWTIRLLAQKAVELEIVPAIGRETVRTTLKKHNLNLT